MQIKIQIQIQYYIRGLHGNTDFKKTYVFVFYLSVAILSGAIIRVIFFFMNITSVLSNN